MVPDSFSTMNQQQQQPLTDSTTQNDNLEVDEAFANQILSGEGGSAHFGEILRDLEAADKFAVSLDSRADALNARLEQMLGAQGRGEEVGEEAGEEEEKRQGPSQTPSSPKSEGSS